MTDTAAPPSSLATFVADRRVPPMLGLGIASGLPLPLVYSTQSAWFYDAKVPIEIVGYMSEMTLAYKFKFVWAPLLDRYDPPLLATLLGRRRGWILWSQILVVLSLTGVAFGDPGHWIAWTVLFSFTLGFAGATQDAMIDGWRITVAPKSLQAKLLSIFEVGWRLGGFVGGAGALYLSPVVGWRGAYLIMAVAMLPGMVATLIAPRPDMEGKDAPPEKSLFVTIVEPIIALMKKLGPMAVPILLLVGGFRLSGYVAAAMEIPLFKHLGYLNQDIATVTKFFGLGVGIASTLLSGYIVPRIGMMASLMIGTVFGSLSHLSLAYLAAVGGKGTDEFWLFAATVSIDTFAYSLASVVLFTYMSTIVAKEYAAPQFALLTSLCALPGSLLAMFSGLAIKHVGFVDFFIGTSLIGIPVAFQCWYVWHKHHRMTPAATS